ncbi:MAG: hypothetical protein LBD07_06880 [Spirochaetaceae bacterium]|jgi:hypothetical protein|nr:hypothetical protein [Spirochaetaceae bacterium]
MMKVRNLCGAMVVFVVFGLLFFSCNHDNNSKPDPLSSSASLEEARAKCNEIISYCNSHSTETNKLIRTSTEELLVELNGMSDWEVSGIMFQPITIKAINLSISYFRLKK